MYASNRYDREYMRIPQNYAGNAFPLQRIPTEVDSESRTQLPDIAHEPEEAPASKESTAPAAVLPHTNEGEAVAPQEHAPVEESREGSSEWLARLGIGQEELLLVGLLLLIRGEQSEDIVWLLLLLLALR